VSFTLGDIDREVHRNLQFQPIFSQTDRWTAINDTIRDLVSYTEFKSTPETADGEIGGIEYNLPDKTIKVLDVMYGRNYLQPMTQAQWIQRGGSEISRRGTPSRYWIRENAFLVIDPPPATAERISIFTTKEPDDLDDEAQVPVLPPYSFSSIVDGACFRLLKNEPEHRDQAQDFERKYNAERAQLNQQLNRNKHKKVRRYVFY
jgi:hypothetical protein